MGRGHLPPGRGSIPRTGRSSGRGAPGGSDMGTQAMPGAARPALGTAHRELPRPASCPCPHRGKLRHGGCREIRAEPGACSPSQNVTFPSPGPTERAASAGGGTSPHGLSPAPPSLHILGPVQIVSAESVPAREASPAFFFLWPRTICPLCSGDRPAAGRAGDAGSPRRAGELLWGSDGV